MNSILSTFLSFSLATHCHAHTEGKPEYLKQMYLITQNSSSPSPLPSSGAAVTRQRREPEVAKLQTMLQNCRASASRHDNRHAC